jgi:hypothetical protein
MATETVENAPPNGETFDGEDTYVAMFAEYLAEATWITPADKPLVFHARKVCAQLDRQISVDGVTQAAKDSAYLQAVERLNKRRPGAAPAPARDNSRDPLEGQTSIFDELS